MKDSFVEFIFDQLEALPEVECRAMFGGHGLYQEEVFFGIVFKGRLFFKTDAKSAPLYRRRGMKPFRPNARQTLKSYYELPADIIEDRDELTEWARRAIAAATRTEASRSR
jgi:DNA transformation protein